MIKRDILKTISYRDKDEMVSSLFQKYTVDMYRVAKSRLDNEDDIYDVIQETAYKLYINFEKISNIDRIKIWLIKVLINECNKIYKIKKRDIKLQEKVLQEKLEKRNFTTENNMDFELLLKALKKEDRTILSLYYGRNYTTKEIAMILHKSENTIRSRIKRWKKIIKEKMEEDE